MILAVGYRVHSIRGVQFRQWATRHLSEYLVKGFTMDDEDKQNMGLTSWKGARVRKQDIIVAKNYLTEDEIDTLNRLTVIFLETAELHVKERRDLTLEFWKRNVDAILTLQGKDILKGKGSVTNAEMEKMVKEVYERFDRRRKMYEARLADEEDMKLLEEAAVYGKNMRHL